MEHHRWLSLNKRMHFYVFDNNYVQAASHFVKPSLIIVDNRLVVFIKKFQDFRPDINGFLSRSWLFEGSFLLLLERTMKSITLKWQTNPKYYWKTLTITITATKM